MPLESITGEVEEVRIKRIEGKGMKNQKGRRVKMDIFGIFDKHFIRKKIFLCFFLCSLKTDFKKFLGTVLFL